MSKNPLVNATGALLYILLVVSVMTWGTNMIKGQNDSFMAPIAMLSLFTLSASVMAYLFCFQPIQLYLDGKKKQAVDLFIKTMATFGVFTAVILGLLFSGVIHG